VEINLLFSFFPSLKWQLDSTHLSLFLSSDASEFEDFSKFLSVSKVLRHFEKVYPPCPLRFQNLKRCDILSHKMLGLSHQIGAKTTWSLPQRI
jgi:hypothetical protein